MKKVMFVFATAFVFAACGNGSNGTQVTTDTTGVKCDTCQVDTTVVADPLPPNPPVGVGSPHPAIDTLIEEPKPKSLPKIN